MRVKLSFAGINLSFTLFERSGDIYAAAETGTLSRVPPDLLTEQALTKIENGYAPIHVAAMLGYLNQIPEERLTPAVMIAPSIDSLNALHYAARNHNLHQVPKSLLTPKILGDRTLADWTPAHEIAAAGDIGLVPKSSLTEEILTSSSATASSADSPSDRINEPASPRSRVALPATSRSVIELCMWNGSVAAIPSSMLTPGVMNAQTCSLGASAMHIVAELGCWDSIPADSVTDETAFLEDERGRTPLHYAAKEGKLREVPAKLFMQASVMHLNEWGETPLHNAALGGHISQIPLQFLTRGNLSSRDGFAGKSAYHYAARSGTLGDLPSTVLGRDDLLVGDNEGMTPLHEAATAKMLDAVPRGIVKMEDLDVRGEYQVSVQTLADFHGCGLQARRLSGYNLQKAIASMDSLPAEPQTGPPTPMSELLEKVRRGYD